MNKKGVELERKLNESKIISNEYLKTLETATFWSKWEKKEEEMKTFSSDAKKLNI